VNRIITDYCVMDVTPAGLKLIEVAPGTSVEQVQSMTEPKLIVAGNVKEIAV
jgi:3-oxoacid CoA-transferase subunit B